MEIVECARFLPTTGAPSLCIPSEAVPSAGTRLVLRMSNTPVFTKYFTTCTVRRTCQAMAHGSTEV